MGLFTGKIKVGEIANNILNKIDDSSLTLQEKATGTIEMMKDLGLTPSSKTRRLVTWLQLTFIMLCYISAISIYRIDVELAKFIKSVPLDYGSNGIIQSINAFFYGGYYLSKNLSPIVKDRLDKRKEKREQEARKTDIKLTKKENRIKRNKINYSDRNG